MSGINHVNSPISINQYQLLNDICSPFNTREEANEYIQSIKDIKYIAGRNGWNMRIYADFVITESDGKFYVWARPH